MRRRSALPQRMVGQNSEQGRAERAGPAHPVQATVCGNDALQAQVSEDPGAQEGAEQVMLEVARNSVEAAWELGVMDEAGLRAAGAQREWVCEVVVGKETVRERGCVRMIQLM